MSTSVKPPVEAPTSRQTRPSTLSPSWSSACASFTPPRDTQAKAGSAAISASRAISSEGFRTGAPSAVTRPAAMAAWALARLSNRPRATRRRSARSRAVMASVTYQSDALFARGPGSGGCGFAAGRRDGGETRLHAVAALPLGVIKRLVGAAHEIPQAGHGVIGLGDADAHRDPQAFALRDERLRLERLAQALGERDRLLAALVRQQQHELLAADPREDVGVALGALAHRGDGANDRISGCVAEPVVDRLEQVDIEDEERERFVVALEAEPFRFCQVEEMAAVANAGQLVGRGEALERLGVTHEVGHIGVAQEAAAG